MAFRSRKLSVAAGAAFSCVVLGAMAMAGESRKPVISRPGYDPALPKVDFFDALEDGTLEARMIAKDQFGGNVLITNNGDAPISVKMPDSIVGVQVFPQGFGGGGLGGGGLGSAVLGGGRQPGGQSIGGGFGGGGLPGGGGLQGGGGFFSIPADRTIRVPFNSVCLEHGKANPTSSMRYQVVRPTDVSDKPELHELLRQIASNKVERGTAQAAAWNIANGMNWQQLSNEKWDHVGGPDTPYFSQGQLAAAQALVAGVKAKVRENAEQQSRVDSEKTTTRGSRFSPRPAAD